MSFLDNFRPKPKAVERDEVMSVNMAKAEPPSITETRGKEYVSFGEDNLFPQELIDYRNRCSLHNAIIQSKALITAGKSVQIERIGSLTPYQEGQLARFMEAPFPQEGTLHEVVAKMAWSLSEQGAIALQVLKDAVDPTRYSMMKVMDVSRVRSGKYEDDGYVHRYYWARDWKTAKDKDIKSYPAFGFGNKEKKDKQSIDMVEVMYVCRKLTGMEYYGLPSYLPALPWVDINMQMGVFHKANLDNGMNPGMVIKFYKKPESEEQKRSIVSGIKSMFGGAKNTGKGMVFFSNGKEEAPDVEPIPTSGLDAQLLQLNEQLWQEIVTGHRVTSPMLLGIATPGKLGYSQELEKAWNIYNTTVIRPEQLLIEQTLNKFFKAMGLPVKATIEPLNPLL